MNLTVIFVFSVCIPLLCLLSFRYGSVVFPSGTFELFCSPFRIRCNMVFCQHIVVRALVQCVVLTCRHFYEVPDDGFASQKIPTV